MALFDDPFGAIQRDIDKVQRRNDEVLIVADSKRQRRSAWDAVAESQTLAPLLALGERLVAEKNDFWVRCWRVILARDAELRGGEFSRGTYGRAATLKMLEAACRRDESALTGLLEQSKRFPQEFHWHASFDDVREILDLWIEDGHVPPTPYVRRQELVAALNGVPGMSASSLCRMVKHSKCLEETETINKHSRYRHKVPETHRFLLSRIVDFLDGKKVHFKKGRRHFTRR